MRGLKIIPLFLVLIVFSYIGVIFVQNNPDEMVIRFFGDLETPPLALGFIILTSALIGMVAAGILCVLELVVLYLQNKSLKRKLEELGHSSGTSFREIMTDTVEAPPAAETSSDAEAELEEQFEEEEFPPPAPPSPYSPPGSNGDGETLHSESESSVEDHEEEEEEDNETTRTNVDLKAPKIN